MCSEFLRRNVCTQYTNFFCHKNILFFFSLSGQNIVAIICKINPGDLHEKRMQPQSGISKRYSAFQTRTLLKIKTAVRKSSKSAPQSKLCIEKVIFLTNFDEERKCLQLSTKYKFKLILVFSCRYKLSLATLIYIFFLFAIKN